MKIVLRQSIIITILVFASNASHAAYYPGYQAVRSFDNFNNLFQGADHEERRIEEYDRQLTFITRQILCQKALLSAAQDEDRRLKALLDTLFLCATKAVWGLETDLPMPLINLIAEYAAPSAELQQEINTLQIQKTLLLTNKDQTDILKKQSSIRLKQMYSCMAVVPHTIFFRFLGENVLRNPDSRFRESLSNSPFIQAVIGSFLAVGTSCMYNMYPLYTYVYSDQYKSKKIPLVHMINGIKTCTSYVALDLLSYLHKRGRFQWLTRRLPLDKCKNTIIENGTKYLAQCDTVLRAYIPRYIRYKKKLKRAGRRLQTVASTITPTPTKRDWAIKTACSLWIAQEYV